MSPFVHVSQTRDGLKASETERSNKSSPVPQNCGKVPNRGKFTTQNIRQWQRKMEKRVTN